MHDKVDRWKAQPNLVWTGLFQIHSPICIHCGLDVLSGILVGQLERGKNSIMKRVR